MLDPVLMLLRSTRPSDELGKLPYYLEKKRTSSKMVVGVNVSGELADTETGELLLLLPEPHSGISTPRPWKIVREFRKP